MRLLLRSAKIHHPTSSGRKDILIENGIIKSITDQINESDVDHSIESNDLHVAPGFMDLNTFCGEPGFEHREDIHSVTQAAAHGGFTEICLLPGTHPALDGRTQIEFILNRSKENLVRLWPIGALTLETKGEKMTEMLDMRDAGAIAFSDGNKGIRNSGIVERALLYARQFEGVVMLQAEDVGLTEGKQMNEGKTAAMLGLEGIPAIAEELGVYRELQLIEYTGAKGHLMNVSSAGSVALIRNAKKNGLPVTCSVNAYSLYFTDEDLMDFDTNMKCNPPFRRKKDIEALKTGLKDGTIDAISTGHTPWDAESKEVEFLFARFGMIGLETAFSLLLKALGDKELDLIMEKLIEGPRKVLGRQVPKLEEGAPANLCIFDPSQSITFHQADILSKSKNTPLLGKELQGKVLGIVQGNQNWFTS